MRREQKLLQPPQWVVVEDATGSFLLPMMIVDHPFFFAMTEKQSGALLFAGVVMDPTLTGGAQ